MQRYANLSGNSGVVAYGIGRDWIDVKFQDGGTYRYTCESASALHIETMKKLALAGRGLSTYIAQHVQQCYASRRP